MSISPYHMESPVESTYKTANWLWILHFSNSRAIWHWNNSTKGNCLCKCCWWQNVAAAAAAAAAGTKLWTSTNPTDAPPPQQQCSSAASADGLKLRLDGYTLLMLLFRYGCTMGHSTAQHNTARGRKEKKEANIKPCINKRRGEKRKGKVVGSCVRTPLLQFSPAGRWSLHVVTTRTISLTSWLLLSLVAQHGHVNHSL